MTYPDTPGYSDPDTSKAAADKIAAVSGDLAQLVLAAISDKPQTCFELETVLGLPHQTASARVRELVLKELVEDSGARRPTASGRNAKVWRRKLKEDE